MTKMDSRKHIFISVLSHFNANCTSLIYIQMYVHNVGIILLINYTLDILRVD